MKNKRFPIEVGEGAHNLGNGINSLLIQKKVLKRCKHFATVYDFLETGRKHN